GDLNAKVILHLQYGLGMDDSDVNKDMDFPSLATVAYRAINEKDLISEEMRLIYVALTRAKEQLILVGRVKDEKSLIKYEQLAVSDTYIAVNERLTATNPFVLIYGVLAKHQSPSLPNDQRFERDIDQLNSEVKPRVS
ncbi:helicase-exonuclease AddAB subunit AddA, partial [Burkholderia cepacia]|nr:helicase-exonuclease AddAB subunit AddA [Burkholderia cepacia]